MKEKAYVLETVAYLLSGKPAKNTIIPAMLESDADAFRSITALAQNDLLHFCKVKCKIVNNGEVIGEFTLERDK